MWAKSTFFSLSEQAVEQNEGSRSLVWVSTPQRGKPFFFLLSNTIIVGLTPRNPGTMQAVLVLVLL